MPRAYKWCVNANSSSLSSAPAIETINLVRRFGDFIAVDPLNLKAERGAIG